MQVVVAPGGEVVVAAARPALGHVGLLVGAVARGEAGVVFASLNTHVRMGEAMTRVLVFVRAVSRTAPVAFW